MRSLEDFFELEKELSLIKGKHLKVSDYYINLTPANWKFLNDTYNEKFFTAIPVMDCIIFNILPSGVRRKNTYTKSRFDNSRNYDKVIEKIRVELEIQFNKMDVAFEIKEIENKKNTQTFIVIKLSDLQTQENTKNDHCLIGFNTDTWVFEIIAIQTSRLKEIYDVIKKTFEKMTAPTRVYRKKLNEDNSK